VATDPCVAQVVSLRQTLDLFESAPGVAQGLTGTGAMSNTATVADVAVSAPITLGVQTPITLSSITVDTTNNDQPVLPIGLPGELDIGQALVARAAPAKKVGIEAQSGALAPPGMLVRARAEQAVRATVCGPARGRPAAGRGAAHRAGRPR